VVSGSDTDSTLTPNSDDNVLESCDATSSDSAAATAGSSYRTLTVTSTLAADTVMMTSEALEKRASAFSRNASVSNVSTLPETVKPTLTTVL
jgi:hypothetical protein